MICLESDSSITSNTFLVSLVSDWLQLRHNQCLLSFSSQTWFTRKFPRSNMGKTPSCCPSNPLQESNHIQLGRIVQSSGEYVLTQNGLQALRAAQNRMWSACQIQHRAVSCISFSYTVSGKFDAEIRDTVVPLFWWLYAPDVLKMHIKYYRGHFWCWCGLVMKSIKLYGLFSLTVLWRYWWNPLRRIPHLPVICKL